MEISIFKELRGKKVSVLFAGLEKNESYVGIVEKIKGNSIYLNTVLKDNPYYSLKGIWIDSRIIRSIWVYK